MNGKTINDFIGKNGGFSQAEEFMLPESVMNLIRKMMGLEFVDIKPDQVKDIVYTCEEYNSKPVNITVMACKDHRSLEVSIVWKGSDPVGLLLVDGRIELVRSSNRDDD